MIRIRSCLMVYTVCSMYLPTVKIDGIIILSGCHESFLLYYAIRLFPYQISNCEIGVHQEDAARSERSIQISLK